jgi:hypothetical protein
VSPCFAFAGIDIDTKLAAFLLRPAVINDDVAAFLHPPTSRYFAGPVEILLADGGPDLKRGYQ